MDYSGNVMYFYNANVGVNFIFNPKVDTEGGEVLKKSNNNDLICPLSKILKNDLNEIEIGVSSMEWQNGKCVSIVIEDVTTGEKKNIGTIGEEGYVLKIVRKGSDCYNIELVKHMMQNNINITDGIRMNTFPASFCMCENIETELEYRIKSDLEIAKYYSTSIENKLNELLGVLREKITDDFKWNLLECEEELAELVRPRKERESY